MQTKPATNKERNIPPFTSFFIPKNNILSVIYTEILWQKYFFQEFIMRLYYDIKSGKSLSKKIAAQCGVSLESIDTNRCFSIHFKGVPELILSPAAFDFPRKVEDKRYFIGPLNDLIRDKKIVNERYIAVRDKIINQKTENPDIKFIYCSLGTITNNFFKKCDIFFRKIKKVCLNNFDFKIIISVGNFYEIERLMPLPKNMFIFSSLPQTDILKYADVMISHGGMNSITECVYNEVPILVYPLSLDWDQPGNSARILYHGLGSRGRIKRDTASVIEKRIMKIMDEYDRIKQNLKQMKQKYELNNKSLQAVQIIENLKKNGK
jgi:MGT family glycosyltransferase